MSRSTSYEIEQPASQRSTETPFNAAGLLTGGRNFFDPAERAANTQVAVANRLLPDFGLSNPHAPMSRTADRSVSKVDASNTGDSKSNDLGSGDSRVGGINDKPAVLDDARIDWNASGKFAAQLSTLEERVRKSMPPAVQEKLRDTKVEPVKSITTPQNQPADGFHSLGRVMVAERGQKGAEARRESILKHEFGHEFDARSGMLSQDPEFRRLVDSETNRNPQVKQIKKEVGADYYAEVFADMFARNLGAPSQQLSMQGIDRDLPSARAWVQKRMR